MPLNQSDLAQFYGTENYYRLPLLFPSSWPMRGEHLNFDVPVATDGAIHVLRNGGGQGAFWLWDVIASALRTAPRCRNYIANGETFFVVRLSVDDDTRSGQVVIDDGNDNVLYQQGIEYTDFDLPEIKFYFIGNVLLLPSEY